MQVLDYELYCRQDSYGMWCAECVPQNTPIHTLHIFILSCEIVLFTIEKKIPLRIIVELIRLLFHSKHKMFDKVVLGQSDSI